MIMRRPWLTGAAVVLIMVGLALPVSRITLSQGTLKQSQGTTPGVAALDYLRTNFATAPDPYVVVIQRSAGTIVSRQDLAAMERLETRIRRDPEVTQVIGASDILGSTRPAPAALRQVIGRLISSDRRTALITVIPRHDATTAANMAGLRRIRDMAARAQATDLRGTQILVGGSSATEVDFDKVIIERLPFIALVVLGLTYLFLFVAFRSVFLPFKAVVLNILSVLAAFGMLQIVFQQGYGVGLLGGSRADGIPIWVLLFLFAFLFGLSMDYEVLLLSRIRESWLRTGNNEESVSQGLEKTGRLISSAAVIMGIAFSGFVLGKGLWMKEMGLGLTVSILLDATLIRVVLVPSIMKIVGSWNWWVPGPLRSWSQRGSIEGEERVEAERERVPA
jgi:RND superfamily putative drug exporter